LWAEGINARDIHKEMYPVYGGKIISRKAFHNWVEKFSQGRTKDADDAGAGRPVEIATEATVHRVEEFFRGDSRITIDSAATALRVFPWFRIQHNSWLFEVSESVRKVGWVPRQLKNREEINRMGLPLQHLRVL
jgi:hypothetical protein